MKEELQNIANAIEEQSNPAKACSDFNGWSVADSMGYIADALQRIAGVMERSDPTMNEEEA